MGAALMVLAGCTPAATKLPGAGPGNQVVFGMTWEPISFYPLRALDSASYYGQNLVYEGLIRYDSRLRMVPALADAFSVSADGMTYRFHLRPGLKFSSGEALTGEDVVASVHWAAAPTSPYHADYEDIADIRVTGKSTLDLILKKPCSPLLSRLIELRILPARVLNLADHGKFILSRNPIGCGPFRLARWESGSELVFEPNAHYWGEKPRVDAIVWQVIPDPTLLALALVKGEVDVAQLDARTLHSLPGKEVGTRLFLDRFPGSRTVYLGFNVRRRPLYESAVRQAVALAIDRRGLVRDLYGGYATEAASDFATSGWAYNRRTPIWPFDREAAEQMLTKAGFSWSGTGWRRADCGLLAFSILTIRDYQDVAQAISADLAKIGISTEVEIVEFSTLRQRYLKRGQYQTVVWSRSVGPDPECLLAWHSTGPLNFSGFRSNRLDGLLEAGRRQIDEKKRTIIYHEIQDILATSLPWVFLMHPQLLIGHSARVNHVQENGQEKTGLPWDNPLFNAARWTVTESK